MEVNLLFLYKRYNDNQITKLIEETILEKINYKFYIRNPCNAPGFWSTPSKYYQLNIIQLESIKKAHLDSKRAKIFIRKKTEHAAKVTGTSEYSAEVNYTDLLGNNFEILDTSLMTSDSPSIINNVLLPHAIKEIVKKARIKQASIAGSSTKKNKGYKILKMEAFKLLKEMKTKKTHKSYKNSAKIIFPIIQAYAEKNKETLKITPLTDTSGEERVYKWLLLKKPKKRRHAKISPNS